MAKKKLPSSKRKTSSSNAKLKSALKGADKSVNLKTKKLSSSSDRPQKTLSGQDDKKPKKATKQVASIREALVPKASFQEVSQQVQEKVTLLKKIILRFITTSTQRWQQHIDHKRKKQSARFQKKNSYTKKIDSVNKPTKAELKKIEKATKKLEEQSAQKWHSRFHPAVKWPLRILLFPVTSPVARYALLLLVIIALSGAVYVLRDLPSPRKLTSKENFAVGTQIFDRNGVLLYEVFADENRVPVPINQVPDHVIQATISIEDENFYRHFGIDVVGVTRAVINNLQGGRLEGGSTITQQLVKNALLTKERSFQRKVKEAFLAVATEVIYTKEQILEMYLNYISYGGTAVGIESAAQYYFDKPASELTLAESALIAGLPQAPSTYSPFGSNPERAKARQGEVLRQMAENGYITEDQAELARNEVLNFAISKTDIKAPHFVFYVRDQLYETYGVETVEKGGLRVTTSLDLELQEVVQASVSAEIEQLTNYRVGNGAAMVVKPNTGEILAMVGSKDYFNEAEDGQVNVALALRQPGSSIKPIMYATAMQLKLLNPGTVLLDVPTCFTVPGQKPYCPKNYDGSFKGPVSVRQALGNSLNIPAVKGLRLIGLVPFIEQATSMGITTWLDPSNYGLSLTLGGGEVRMIDMAQAFSVLANQGVKTPLTPILKVEDFKGQLIDEVDVEERLADLEYLTLYDDESSSGDLERVMDRAPAYLVSHIMQDNNARTAAFGPRSELVIPDQIVSVKTGTTNDLKDNWTVGFTPEYLTITWVGNNDSTPMNPYVVSGVTGAAPIFNDIMSYVLANEKPVWQEKPADVASGNVCATGFPAELSQVQCSGRYEELFWQKSQPSASKTYKKEIWVKEDTGLPPAPGEQADNLVLREQTVLGDPLTPFVCTDCGQPAVNEDGQPSSSFSQQTIPHDYQPGSDQNTQ